MTALTPEIAVGAEVCHWPTRERGRIVGALPCGFTDWLYLFTPDDQPSVIRYCDLDALATFDNVFLLAAFRLPPRATTAGAGGHVPPNGPWHPSPNGGRAA